MSRLRKLFFFALIALTSCEHSVYMETSVQPNGQLDKVMTFEAKDSTKNILGISGRSGWSGSVNMEQSTINGKDSKWITTWKKSFSSAKEANDELASPSDTLFRVTSTFERKFRWFYTYLFYSDTYHAINKMKVPINDYVTKEDYMFIDRLPAEGARISKADSLYLTELNKKLFDIYGLRAIYEDYYNIHVQLMRDNKVEQRWYDTLRRHKEEIFSRIDNGKDVEDDYMLHAMDSLHIPLPYAEFKSRYKSILKPATDRTDFIALANEGKYIHRINMPWEVIRTNADSVAGNHLFWKPPVIKFLIKDYTMYVESRQWNYWAMIVSLLVIGLTVFVFARKRRSY